MPNDQQIVVSPGLDWTTNDTIGLAPTTINWFEADYAVITSYNNVTGVVTLDRPMSNYHYGAQVSTGAKYSGVDMRGEVMLLSRNIRIVGNDSNAWGGQVLTGDFIEADGTSRTGYTFMDNVEIYNCS